MKLAIISDIHEDVESLKLAMSIINKKTVDKIVCLGDIVGFNIPYYNYIDTKNASECIKIVKENCDIVIAGNHDIFEAKRIPLHKANFDYPPNWYSLDYQEKKNLSKGQIWLHEENTLPSLISNSEKEYLFNLPEYKIAEFGNIKILFSHFVFPDIVGTRADFLMKESSFHSHLDFLKEQNCDIGFSGHGHIEGVCTFNEKRKKIKNFGKVNIKRNRQGFVIPCIARGKQSNGFVIFDTKKMLLDVISIKHGKLSQYFLKN